MPRRPCRDAKRLFQNGGNSFYPAKNSEEPPSEALFRSSSAALHSVVTHW